MDSETEKQLWKLANAMQQIVHMDGETWMEKRDAVDSWMMEHNETAWCEFISWFGYEH